MKVLVTGANGFLGLGIVKELLDRGCQVMATDLSLEFCDDRAEKRECDLFSIKDPFEYFGKPDILLHLAWKDGFIHNADSHILFLSQHHIFLKKMFESDVKQIAVLGTMHEVGFHEGSIDENTNCSPLSLYGIAKNALRMDAEYLNKLNDKNLMWLRGFYIVGNTSHGSSIFSKIVQAFENGETEFPFTMGLNQFDFLDYPNFCKQVTAAILQTRIVGIINICSGRPEKLATRVERFIAENNFNISLQYGVFPDRPYDSKAIWGNNTKIEQILADEDSTVSDEQ
ncbi:NAD-dependent epimerase/dehydratase family protein [Streptococcus suis]|uniref:NAD(P)-dependent oxidoreductase n=1 Tax=Streptococcus suis TaxID=1307 RepID=A0A4T2H2L9_STRSU|nr:NAD(P)-dependent oxidoreductase [Streptococcus suis]MBM7317831.1 NAD(P)-dependent oxidoreductase [Streptococcus suis]MBY4635214.1 NAD(P)-dependent oxidoreductase [Streptococcus suis]MBY4963676.1 NAD(P)-dependent oxidoreductase [Streptococcus suis]MCK4043267.1 NAD(P)-dependent oxidoreductase [Streptococcus suis]MCO8241383.1 NAD(P)-dependent oxidoreductase [Streptococcus suis]